MNDEDLSEDEKNDRLRRFARLVELPVLNAYDKDCSGDLDASEKRALDVDLSETPERVTERYTWLRSDVRTGGTIRIKEEEVSAPPKAFPRLFIGRDKVDTKILSLNAQRREDVIGVANGALVSFSNDKEADVETISIDGVVTYGNWRTEVKNAFFADKLNVSAYSWAPYVDVHGEITSKDDADASVVEVGFDAQVEFGDNDFLDGHYLSIAPAFQTDFDGEARIYAVKASWTPYNVYWNLGSRRKETGTFRDYYYLQGSLDADLRFVDEIGETNLTEDEYAWLGGNGTLKLFPLRDVISERLYLEFTGKAHWDAANGETAASLKSGVGLTLTDDERVSINANYEKGKRYRTLEDIEQYNVDLEFRY